MAWGDPYFAWVDEAESFDPVLHRRMDEEVEDVDLSATENGFALLTLKVRPPDGGILKPSRKQWGILSRERADGSLRFMAKGKVDSFPLGGDPEEAEIVFKCAPGDWEQAQDAVLQPTKSGPWWDPALVDPALRDDPVEILDGQSKVVAFHPATHECQLHDLFGYGLPTWDIGLNWFDDSLRAEIAEPPISEVEIEVSAQWTQRRSGWFFATGAINSAFGGQPNTLTPDDLQNRWPRAGDGIGNDNGYSVRSSELIRVYPEGQPLEAGPFQGSSDVYNYITDSNLTAPVARGVMIERAWYEAAMTIAWKAEQARHERVVLRLRSGVQDSGIGNGGVRRLQLECQDVTVDEVTPPWRPATEYAVGDFVSQGGRRWRRLVAGTSEASWAADFTYFDHSTSPPVLRQAWAAEADDGSPIGGPDRGAYFSIARGAQTLLAALFRGRAVLAEGQRCVEVVFEVPLDDAVEAGLWVGMRCRIQVPAGRLAIEGTHAIGKVAAYRMRISADEDTCEITLRCAIGSGAAAAVPAGAVEGSQLPHIWDKISLVAPDASDVRQMATGGIVRVRVENAAAAQAAYVSANDYSPPSRTDPKETDPVRLLGDAPTHVIFDLVPLAADGELMWEAEVDCGTYEGPRQADLGG